MLSCEEVARLVSESLDRDLSRFERMKLKMHHFMCKACRNYKEQILFLHKALQKFCSDESLAPEEEKLSDEARLKIKTALKEV